MKLIKEAIDTTSVYNNIDQTLPRSIMVTVGIEVRWGVQLRIDIRLLHPILNEIHYD